MRRKISALRVAKLLLLLVWITTPGAAQLLAPEMQFVRISPGDFMMGCSEGDNDCGDEEKPAHRVRITKAFEIGAYEVTQAQWQSVMGTNYSEFRVPVRPVEYVSWNDAQEFLRRMTARQDGFRYRLPTEAEWEFAARAGTMGAYPGEADQMGWYYENSGEQTHPVGQKQPNPWGLYDMSGNVYEWTEDWYDAKYYQSSVTIDPIGPSSGRFHTIRGGSWVDSVQNARVSKRDYFEDAADFHIGFRCVREPARRIAE